MSEQTPYGMPTVRGLGLIARSLTRVGDARLRALGFATAQLPVLAALMDGGALSQAELVRLAKVEQPSMAQMLARMERDGLIRRAPDPDDRRSALVSLTEAARAKGPDVRAVLQASNAEVIAGLSAVEVETLGALLQRVLANVERMDAPARAPSQGSQTDVVA